MGRHEASYRELQQIEQALESCSQKTSTGRYQVTLNLSEEDYFRLCSLCRDIRKAPASAVGAALNRAYQTLVGEHELIMRSRR